MENKFLEIKTALIGVLAIVYAFITSLFGVFTPLLIITVGTMFADLCTRIYAASAREDEEVESKLVMKGIYKKIGLCMLIVLALMVDTALLFLADLIGVNIVSKIMVTALVMAWLLVRELISNAENLQHAGIELPSFFIKILGIAKNKIDEAGDTMVGVKDGDEQ